MTGERNREVEDIFKAMLLMIVISKTGKEGREE